MYLVNLYLSLTHRLLLKNIETVSYKLYINAFTAIGALTYFAIYR